MLKFGQTITSVGAKASSKIELLVQYSFTLSNKCIFAACFLRLTVLWKRSLWIKRFERDQWRQSLCTKQSIFLGKVHSTRHTEPYSLRYFAGGIDGFTGIIAGMAWADTMQHEQACLPAYVHSGGTLRVFVNAITVQVPGEKYRVIPPSDNTG